MERLWRQPWPFLFLWLSIFMWLPLVVLKHALDSTSSVFSGMKILRMQQSTSSCSWRLLCSVYLYVNEAAIHFSLTACTHACRLQVSVGGQSWRILTMRAFLYQIRRHSHCCWQFITRPVRWVCPILNLSSFNVVLYCSACTTLVCEKVVANSLSW
jgi:hypothetical protein